MAAIFFLDFFETLSDCFWAFQSIMSPTTQLPGAGDFQDRKRIFGRKYISCQLPAVAFNFLSWRSGNPLKQMLGNKCSFLSSVLFGTFYLLDCFVWSKHLLAWKVSLFLCLIPLSEIFSDLPRLICFECDPPKSLGTRTDRFIKRRWEDQNRYRPNRAAEEMRPKQGHFKDFAKNISCNFIRWRRWRSKQIGGRLRSKQQWNMSNRCDATTTLCCGH